MERFGPRFVRLDTLRAGDAFRKRGGRLEWIVRDNQEHGQPVVCQREGVIRWEYVAPDTLVEVRS